MHFEALYNELMTRQWTVARYRFEFKVQTHIHLPFYSGSTLRGAFGSSLRRISCMTKQKDCSGCPLCKHCPYIDIFEAPAPEHHQLQRFNHIPAPYIFEPPVAGDRVYEPGESLIFHIVLFGKATDYLALIIYSLQDAFSHQVGKGKASLMRVVLETSNEELTIYSEGDTNFVEHKTSVSFFETLNSPNGNCKIKLLTPLRLQDNGRILEVKEITGRILLMAMVRRTALLQSFFGSSLELPFTELNELAKKSAIESNLSWLDWIRYSSRQKQKMHLGGWVGHVDLKEIEPIFIPFIRLSEYIHVGKNTVFGLGKIALQNEQ